MEPFYYFESNYREQFFYEFRTNCPSIAGIFQNEMPLRSNHIDKIIRDLKHFGLYDEYKPHLQISVKQLNPDEVCFVWHGESECLFPEFSHKVEDWQYMGHEPVDVIDYETFIRMEKELGLNET